MIPAYTKIHPFSHRDVREIFFGDVTVEEKIDGSQFSFAVVDGEIQCRSKGVMLPKEDPGLFAKGVATAKSLPADVLGQNVFRCEFLQKNRHNVLTYNRVPHGHIILWDVEFPDGRRASFQARQEYAQMLGLETVPVFMHGRTDPQSVKQFLSRESFLGGPKVEGVIVKRDGMVAKLVSDDFKEMHTGKKASVDKTSEDVRERVARQVCTEARYAKVRQHLRDRGELVGDRTDLGKLIKELHQDIDAECTDAVKELLFDWAIKEVKKHAARGLPAWYENRLQFESLQTSEDE